MYAAAASRIARHKRYVERVEAVDPGRGRPLSEATPARQAQLETIAGQVAEIERLDSALGKWSRSPERSESWTQRFRQANRGAIAEAHRGQPQKDLSVMHAGLRELEQEREAKRKLREIGERRKAGPPDPRAASVTGAVMSDEETFDLMRRKLREVQVPGQVQKITTADPVLEPGHVAVLYVLLHALEDRGEVMIRVNGSVGAWRDEFELPATPGLPTNLAHLRRNGYFDVVSTGNARRVRYGPRTKRIAQRWAISLRPVESSEEVKAANA